MEFRLTVYFLLLGMLYMGLMKFLYAKIVKKHKTILSRYIYSILQVLGVFVILLVYFNQFEATKNISKSLLTSSSLIIAIVTFSAQKVLGNVVSGFAIAVTKPFDIGEKITLLSSSGGVVLEGVVLSITIRHTLIKQIDGKCCLIPNSVMDECIIVNSDTLDNNGHPFPMWCSYDSDVDRAMEIMYEEIQKNELTIKVDSPQSQILCADLGDDGFKLQAVIWTKTINDNYKACSELRLSIYKAWKKEGIEIPYHTYTVKQEQ